MLEMEENVGPLCEIRTMEAQNAERTRNHCSQLADTNNNMKNDDNEDEVFDEITPLVTSQRQSSMVEDSIEWASLLGDEREEGGEEGVGGSIAERRAATCGFNAAGFSGPMINVALSRSVSPLSSPVARSPYITIPAGISPTELLDSPIMLSDTQAQPSPTTGTFELSSRNCESSVAPSATDGESRSDSGSSFRFQHHENTSSMAHGTDQKRENDAGSSMRFQLHESGISLASWSSMMSKDLESPVEFPPASTKNFATESSAILEDSSKSYMDHLASQSCSEAGDQMPLRGDVGDVFEQDPQGLLSSSELTRTSEDGYNWRKYGQKQVKGSEFPRSYYKCTHSSCLVKKKVERSHEGEITEIIYNGAHNHPIPQPNPRSNVGTSFYSENGAGNESCDEVEGGGGIVWRNIQLGSSDIRGPDSRSTSPGENPDPSMMTQMKPVGLHEAVDSSGLVQNFYDEDVLLSDSKSPEEDADIDQSEPKRRKMQSPLTETNIAPRGIREPKVVVQIESEVDILDDGYRWRKYGQKVVKGNPNPRSYYKCTSAGCPVRKHVERACNNFKFVITTYEGKHDHELPTAKIASVSGTSLAPSASGSLPPYALSRANVNAPRPEPQVPDLALHFEKIPDLSSNFLWPSLLGSYGRDMYQMKPPLPDPMPYGSYGMRPDFPIPLLYDSPRPPNLGPGGMSTFNSISTIQSSVRGQQPTENDSGLIKPKQEST